VLHCFRGDRGALMIRRKQTQVLHPLAATDLVTIELSWDEGERVWTTVAPELDHLATFGATQEEALDKTAEAILLFLDVSEDYGDKIPLSRRRCEQLRELLRPVARR